MAGADRQAGRLQERQYLNVPYSEKDEAKQLGAKWDRAKKLWYVPPGGGAARGINAALLARWAPHALTPTPTPDENEQELDEELTKGKSR